MTKCPTGTDSPHAVVQETEGVVVCVTYAPVELATGSPEFDQESIGLEELEVIFPLVSNLAPLKLGSLGWIKGST